MKNGMNRSLLSLLICAASLPAFAAESINLRHQSAASLKSFFSSADTTLVEVKREVDFNQTLHIRVAETYLGYPIWNAAGVLHMPHVGQSDKPFTALINKDTTMNGVLYQALAQDLDHTTPQLVMKHAQAALQHAIAAYAEKIGHKPMIKPLVNKLVVYVDDHKKAHWAFYIQFDAPPPKEKAAKERPTFIIDAESFAIYKQWNDIKTSSKSVAGGGFGGNRKMGQMTYDGGYNHLPKLKIQRDDKTKICYLQNADVTVRDAREDFAIMQFPCDKTDAKHHDVYWSGDHDAINGAYSPSNDALYEGAIIKEMYKKWYQLNVLERDGKPMMLNMVVHENMENAYWDGKQMVFGDGDGIFMLYPLTSLDVAAHEISHGFTEQHSNLTYEGQSGGMNESFSDMAAQAAYYYAEGRNNWMIGSDITLYLLGDALRYMDQPSKDCKRSIPLPGNNQCSIDDASQYTDDLDVHFSSGVYNHFFYFLATSPKWNTHKAFDVMVQANSNYWTPHTDFNEGACGVIQATKDYGYDIKAVERALAKVKIETTQC